MGQAAAGKEEPALGGRVCPDRLAKAIRAVHAREATPDLAFTEKGIRRVTHPEELAPDLSERLNPVEAGVYE